MLFPVVFLWISLLSICWLNGERKQVRELNCNLETPLNFISLSERLTSNKMAAGLMDTSDFHA